MIGVEDNKPEAIAALKAAQENLGIAVEVITVPTIYPTGGAKELIRVLTGKEVPASKRSTDFSVQVFNVATVQSAWRAVMYGEPLISRIVTLSGNVGEARNWSVPIGMPIGELIALAQPQPDTDGIVMGGPMMGFRVPTPDAPVIKATNCLLAHSVKLFPPNQPSSNAYAVGPAQPHARRSCNRSSFTGGHAPANSTSWRTTNYLIASNVAAVTMCARAIFR